MKPGKYLKSEDNGAIFVYDESTAKLPQMRVIHITGEEVEAKALDAVTVEVSQQPELRREDYEALYIEKYKRKPHPRMRMENIRAAVEAADGNDHSASDS